MKIFIIAMLILLLAWVITYIVFTFIFYKHTTEEERKRIAKYWYYK